jgi:hypothetical protein
MPFGAFGNCKCTVPTRGICRKSALLVALSVMMSVRMSLMSFMTPALRRLRLRHQQWGAKSRQQQNQCELSHNVPRISCQVVRLRQPAGGYKLFAQDLQEV